MVAGRPIGPHQLGVCMHPQPPLAIQLFKCLRVSLNLIWMLTRLGLGGRLAKMKEVTIRDAFANNHKNNQ